MVWEHKSRHLNYLASILKALIDHMLFLFSMAAEQCDHYFGTTKIVIQVHNPH